MRIYLLLLFAYHLGLGGGLKAELAVLVLLDALVEDSVGDLIAELVGVALTHGLRGEVDVSGSCSFHLLIVLFVQSL
jgi:hypothetical protein